MQDDPADHAHRNNTDRREIRDVPVADKENKYHDDGDTDNKKEGIPDYKIHGCLKEEQGESELDAPYDTLRYPFPDDRKAPAVAENQKKHPEDETGGRYLPAPDPAGDHDDGDGLHRFKRDRQPVIEPGEDEPDPEKEEDIARVDIGYQRDGKDERDDCPEVPERSGKLRQGEAQGNGLSVSHEITFIELQSMDDLPVQRLPRMFSLMVFSLSPSQDKNRIGITCFLFWPHGECPDHPLPALPYADDSCEGLHPDGDHRPGAR